jgi:hypothetical protein
MECGIHWQIVKSIMALWICKLDTQLNNIISHGAITPQAISHFTAPPIRL